MYELKKNGKVLTSKFVGTGSSSYEKRIYRAAVSQRLRNTDLRHTLSNNKNLWSHNYYTESTNLVLACRKVRQYGEGLEFIRLWSMLVMSVYESTVSKFVTLDVRFSGFRPSLIILFRPFVTWLANRLHHYPADHPQLSPVLSSSKDDGFSITRLPLLATLPCIIIILLLLLLLLLK